MDRHSDILELLDVVRGDIEQISIAYAEARSNEVQENVLRPKIKSCFENLRSCLEYSAQDVWRSYTRKKNSVYFPYGKTEVLFLTSIKKNLPALPEQAPLVYKLIESIQPFVDESDWLYELCKHTNFNKHNGLSVQVRKNSSRSTTTFGNLLRIEGHGTITFVGSTFNGVPIGKDGSLTISSDRTVAETVKDINIPVSLSREFDWVKFEIEGSAYDTLELIKHSYLRISDYIAQLYKII
ncbi:hypothetical protein [Pseudomonas sp. 2995-1]|uniref:hypothetical protein n=1 Tax=Pseudomonas sp. 2995-1 TaxID=1712679 RepID=UPI000C147BF7|nr:hypothetical protein [Pseudomonas sp. 2995-1]PIB54055.1 hypothetical protein AOA61_22285 [Pseudomonas sp. 2995-1]